MDISNPIKLLLKHCKLFAGFSESQLDEAISCLIPRHLIIEDGEPLYKSGDVSDKCWVIISGKFAVHSKGLLHSKPQQHLSYEVGEVTGLQGIVDSGSHRPVTILAEGRLEVVEIHESGIAKLSKEIQIHFLNNVSTILLEKIMKSRFSLINPDL
ncbi:MAG: cyclic nucleotide-binding domain-containing protein [Magnetococcales bacterium]|nr:cyclic nucleotide-binding domain-containing protein [Magnetococcales bacterium]